MRMFLLANLNMGYSGRFYDVEVVLVKVSF